MPKVYIADKKTLDNVQKDTEYIRSQFPISGGTDWSRYETLEQEQKTNIYINQLENKNILLINGKGYIRDLIIYRNCGVIIYVDDKEIYKESANDYSCYLGFEYIGDRSYDSKHDLKYIARHRCDIGDINTKLIIQPISFEKSLRVKIWDADHYNSFIKTLYFLGGIKK